MSAVAAEAATALRNRDTSMNVHQIQIRAYFHFENRTGEKWADPVSNWIQAEQEEKLLHITATIRPFICALLCLKEDDPSPEGVVSGGSAAFIDTGAARIIVTAEHVTRALFQPGIRAILVGGNGTHAIDISHLRDQVSSRQDIDLATIKLPHTFKPDAIQRAFLEVPDWPAPRAEKGELAFFLGYPGLHREPSERGLELSISPFCDFVTSVSDRHFVLVDEKLERRAASLSSRKLLPFGPTGGMSGSLVFVNRFERLIPVGVLYEGGDGVDAMFFVTHIDRILRGGTVSDGFR